MKTPALYPRIALFLLLLVIALVPLGLCQPLPLNDLPAHIARLHILGDDGASEWLGRYYRLDLYPLPRLALEIVVPLVSPALPVEAAITVFVALTLALMASGVIAVNWVLHGTRSLLPFAVFLLLYNRQFLWGAVAYLFTLGLAFWLFALWIGVRERTWWARLLVFAVAVAVLYLCHALAAVAYAAMVIGFELHWTYMNRQGAFRALAGHWLVTLGQFAAPVVLFVATGARIPGFADVGYGSVTGRLSGLADPFLNYSLPLDLATVVAGGLILALGLATRRMVLHPAMTVVIAVLLLLYMVVPDQIFGFFGSGRRMVVPLAMALLAGLDWDIASAAWRRLVMTAVVVVFAVRIAVVGANWRAADAVYADILGQIDRIEPGARLYTLVARPARPALQNPPLTHLSAMAVVRRDALVNTLHADRGGRLVHYAYPPGTPFAGDRRYEFIRGSDPIAIGLADIDPAIFQYLLVIDADAFELPTDGLTPVARGAGSTLYRIHGTNQPSQPSAANQRSAVLR